MLANRECARYAWNKSCVNGAICWLGEVLWEIVEKLANDIVGLMQGHKQVIWLGQVIV